MAGTIQIHQCHQLDLPAELRNRIYEFVLVEDEPIVLFDWNLRCTDYRWQPKLLRTCKTIRSEAGPIFYGQNTFHYPRPWKTPKLWKDGIRLWTADQLSMVKCVRLNTIKKPSPGRAASALKGARLWLKSVNINIPPNALYAEESPGKWTNGGNIEPDDNSENENVAYTEMWTRCRVESSHVRSQRRQRGL